MPLKDPEKRQAYAKANYAKNKERLKAVRHAWYLKNKDKIAAKAKEQFAYRKEYLNGRKTEINDRRRWRYANDPEYRNHIIARVKAREWDILPDEYASFAAMYDQECYYCGAEPGLRNAVDHLIPRSRGGEDRLYNLVPSCQSCNSKKGTKTPEEFYLGSPLRRPEAPR